MSKISEGTWTDVQIQMEVLAIPFANVAVAKFKEYPDLDDFLLDDIPRLFVGALIRGGDGNVLYGPCKFESGLRWRKALVDWSLTQSLVIDNAEMPVPFYMDTWVVMRIERDRAWFKSVLPGLEAEMVRLERE
jgi:hypothetical protein